MFTLLRHAEDWDQYRKQLAAQAGLSGVLINWGNGPKTYPCLVCSTDKGPMRMISAYVYKADAEKLLRFAANSATVVPGPAQVAPASARTLVDYYRHVAAHFLTVAYFMVETGLCKPEQFESKMIEFLAKVDQWSVSKKGDATSPEVLPLERSILDRLDPAA